MSAVPASSEDSERKWRPWSFFYEEGLALREMLCVYDGEFDPEAYADMRIARQEKEMARLDLKV